MDQSIIARPTFEQMVKDLFKVMEGPGAAMLHAAIGIAGETGELRQALTRKNQLEESSDIEFYIEAMWQQMPLTRETASQEYPPYCLCLRTVDAGNALDHIHVEACEILDHAKKVWVYGSGDRSEHIMPHLLALSFYMGQYYELIGVTREDILRINQDKLLGNEKIAGRYATGKYSDEQALARADKVEEEGTKRSFLGQRQ
jgi:hypothetical protein